MVVVVGRDGDHVAGEQVDGQAQHGPHGQRLEGEAASEIHAVWFITAEVKVVLSRPLIFSQKKTTRNIVYNGQGEIGVVLAGQ